jgi:uncharacterized membrane protein
LHYTHTYAALQGKIYSHKEIIHPFYVGKYYVFSTRRSQMEIIIALVVVVLGAALYFNRKSTTLDVNHDGKVDAKDAVAAAEKVEQAVVTEVKAVETAVVAEVKAVATKAKSAAKKPAAKKAAPVKKAAAKKPAPAKKVPAKKPAKPKK